MLHLLGTGAPYALSDRTTTMLALEDGGQVLLVDCGGDAAQRLVAAGLSPADLSGVILTHTHADHVGGFPLLIEKLWVGKRTATLPVYGLQKTLDLAQRLLDVFGADEWDGLFPLDWHAVPETPLAPVFEDDAFEVVASPVVHAVPTLGLRVTFKQSGHALAYSCDTEPCANVVELARGTRLLVHEASGEGKGHSSARQAAEVAEEAGVPLLVLVHVPPSTSDDDLAEARTVFPATMLGKEGGRLRV